MTSFSYLIPHHRHTFPTASSNKNIFQTLTIFPIRTNRNLNHTDSIQHNRQHEHHRQNGPEERYRRNDKVHRQDHRHQQGRHQDPWQRRPSSQLCSGTSSTRLPRRITFANPQPRSTSRLFRIILSAQKCSLPAPSWPSKSSSPPSSPKIAQSTELT